MSIYNWPGLARCGGDVVKMLATMDAAFKEGTAVCILEPFFKTRMDGTRGVRVDNPAAELVLDVAAPKSSADWKTEGNAHVGYLPRRSRLTLTRMCRECPRSRALQERERGRESLGLQTSPWCNQLVPSQLNTLLY